MGACSRKTLFHLISTLNQSYGGDYDFSSVKSDEFSHEPSCTWVKVEGLLFCVLLEHLDKFKFVLKFRVEL